MEFEKLKQIVAEILSVDPRELTEETNFIEHLDRKRRQKRSKPSEKR